MAAADVGSSKARLEAASLASRVDGLRLEPGGYGSEEDRESIGELMTATWTTVGKGKASLKSAIRSRRADGGLQVDLLDVSPTIVMSPSEPASASGQSPVLRNGAETLPPSARSDHSAGQTSSHRPLEPRRQASDAESHVSKSLSVEPVSSRGLPSPTAPSSEAPSGPQRSASSFSLGTRISGDGRGKRTGTMTAEPSSRERLKSSRTDATKRPQRSMRPRLPEADVEPAPASGMYWSLAPAHGSRPPPPMRSHTASLVGDTIWVIGGMAASQGSSVETVGEDGQASARAQEVWQLDADTFRWSRARCTGDGPPAGRSHSATVVDGRIFVFGGGDNVEYTNDLYYLDTVTKVWTRPEVFGTIPSARRAHQAVLHGDKILIYGGGNGASALYDLFALDVSDLNRLEWVELHPKGDLPPRRGYHTATLVGKHMVVIGGSDGGKCYDDIHTLNLETMTWRQVELDGAIPRIGHSITCVGSYLFMVGGHDGQGFSNDIWLFNLVSLQWEERSVYGQKPPPLAYHSTVMSDLRLLLIGGYDEKSTYEHVYSLDLGASAYYPQVTDFTTPFE